uniref:Uncharacterized protein n=1 Tax=Rhizophagus irregularis (strain DAOM 181602 / DAOM 197198 / MUCL 43194) TaxID=747089 RepID=U9TA83_RHIID
MPERNCTEFWEGAAQRIQKRFNIRYMVQQNYPKSSLDDILDHKLNLSKIFDLKIEENYGISRIILYNTIQKDKNTIVMDVLEEPFRDEQNFNKFIRHIPNILQHINFTFLIHDINDKTSGKTAIVLLQNEKWHIVKFLEFLKSYGLSSVLKVVDNIAILLMTKLSGGMEDEHLARLLLIVMYETRFVRKLFRIL